MIRLREIALPLNDPFQSSGGIEHNRRVVIVEAHCDGYVGYGEASPLSAPYYTEETPDTVWYSLKQFLVPAVFQHRVSDVSDNLRAAVQQTTTGFSSIKRHFMAKTGIENALWDLFCKLRGIPLYRALGGVKPVVSAGIALGMTAGLDALVKQVEDALLQRYHRIKIKIGPGHDIEPIETLRTRFNDIPLAVDANGSYKRSDMDHLLKLDSFGLTMIEQPLEAGDFTGHSLLQGRMSTPLCLDESIEEEIDAIQAIDTGACGQLNVKPGRIGGTIRALRMHDLCVHHGIPAWIGGLLESDIGRAHNMALATLPGFSLPGDLSPSSRYFKQSIVSPTFTLRQDGTMEIPSNPGIGVRVDVDFLRHITLRTLDLTPD